MRNLVSIGTCLLLVAPIADRDLAARIAPADQPTVFVNVNLVAMDNDQVRSAQTVIVRDGRIAEIGPTARLKVPAGALQVDGRGKYLMPGLADMHAHLRNRDLRDGWVARSDPGSEGDLLLYVANGVTTIRNMWGEPRTLAWRERIAKGELLGPTIYTTGPIIDGNPPVIPGATIVETAEQAERVVAEQKQAGYDFLKAYFHLTGEAYGGLVAAASKHGMRIAGHTPRSGLQHSLSARQASIEHLWGYADAMQVPDSPVRGNFDFDGRLQAMKYLDESKMPALAKASRDAGVWNCITMIVQHNWSAPERARKLLGRPEMKYVPPSRLTEWAEGRRANLTASEAELEGLRHEFHKRLTKALHDAGARLLLGTDTGNPMVLEGFSAHEELKYLVDAGLTPFEAIRTGTYDAAEFLGGLEEFGTVAVGRRADLILLDGNPLEDVTNLQRRAGVMLRGRWLPATELQQKLDELAASYRNVR